MQTPHAQSSGMLRQRYPLRHAPPSARMMCDVTDKVDRQMRKQENKK